MHYGARFEFVDIERGVLKLPTDRYAKSYLLLVKNFEVIHVFIPDVNRPLLLDKFLSSMYRKYFR